MDRVKVGVIGVGTIGIVHATALASSPLAELVGIAEINDELRERVSSGLGIKGYADYQALIRTPGIQAVSICTPDHSHLKPVKEPSSSSDSRGEAGNPDVLGASTALPLVPAVEGFSRNGQDGRKRPPRRMKSLADWPMSAAPTPAVRLSSRRSPAWGRGGLGESWQG